MKGRVRVREQMVKFGKLLQEDIDKYHEWVPSDKYLDYERLKDIIYDRIEVSTVDANANARALRKRRALRLSTR